MRRTPLGYRLRSDRHKREGECAIPGEICRGAEGNPILRGWVAYYKLTETKQALEEMDGWIRRKLRCMLWRQWKRP